MGWFWFRAILGVAMIVVYYAKSNQACFLKITARIAKARSRR
jgi:hypothetical protein